MSLDVYLYGPESRHECDCPNCGNGHWAASKPQLYSANITHNLGKMADEAGIYYALWRPEEIGATKASDIAPLLRDGLYKLKTRPSHFEAFNAPNGWGLYEHFVPFVEAYLAACDEHPDATIEVSR